MGKFKEIILPQIYLISGSTQKAEHNALLFDCLFMLRTTPIALIKTTSEVLPALMNGKGRPVGGIEPDMSCFCTKNYSTIMSEILNL